ncbi:hypothetical protein BDFB_001602 [Asbolus verrucosus]|uniref:Uncharacterized protein n=1 Tax=Asbolus verrucosus TaxID=1661398 RepID=A0A482WCU7_ASBVE|nr:hypothetical protein BDFB_001602 [Asbolus verrucosus]
MLPIVQDNMNCIAGVRGLTNLSSNGYYGYQPPLLLDRQKEEVTPSEAHVPAVPPCSMEVQFESLPQNQNAHRKRSWEFNNYFREFKKRRQNGKFVFLVYF